MTRLLLLYMLLIVVLQGCTPQDRKPGANWTMTLSSTDKNPYGAYLAFQSLKFYFPDAKTETLSRGFKYSSMTENMKYNYSGRSLLIIAGFSFNVTDNEWEQLKQFMRNGNEVVLLSSSLDDKIGKEFRFYKTSSYEENYATYLNDPDFNSKNILCFATDTQKKYGYTGRSVKSYFIPTNASSAGENNSDTSDTYDPPGDNSTVADTLGLVYGNPDLVRYTVGEGHLTLHAAPLVVSNFFLLQKDNINYLSALWQTLPRNITKIYWSSCYYRTADVSSWDILWRYPSTRMALLLGILLLLIYILFEGKRKQRIIPVIAPIKNDSVSFVETVGRLYYNKGNHANLAAKMVQQFLEWVRTNYFLNTNQLNEQFIKLLVIKSGQPEATVRGLMEMVHEIRMNSAIVDDAYLYQLYNTIQIFYKNLHK